MSVPFTLHCTRCPIERHCPDPILDSHCLSWSAGIYVTVECCSQPRFWWELSLTRDIASCSCRSTCRAPTL